MRVGKDAERGFDWVGLPVVVTVAWLLCRELGALQPVLFTYHDFPDGHRPHHGIGSQILDRLATGDQVPDQVGGIDGQKLSVNFEQLLGGLLNSCYCRAA